MLASYKLKLFTLAVVLVSIIYTPIYAFNLLQEKSRIITASAVRVRSNPQTSSTEITKLSVGTVVKEIGKSERKEKVGQQEDFWYQVVLSDGKQGWVFGAFTDPFDQANKEKIYINLLNERLKAKTSFNDQIDMVNFLEQVVREIKSPNVLAELELGQILILQKSLESIPPDKEDSGEYKSWLKKQKSKIFYDDIQGIWLVDKALFTELHKKYASLPIGDRIIWEEVNSPLGGECEGFIECYIRTISVTNGKYLSLYPQGEHSEEAIKSIFDELNTYLEDLKRPQPTYTFPESEEMRKHLQESLGELRKNLSKVPEVKISKIFKQIEQLAQKFR